MLSNKKVKQVQVSQSSLAQVCSASKEAVNSILKEIFHKVAEKGRHGQEIRLDLRIG